MMGCIVCGASTGTFAHGGHKKRCPAHLLVGGSVTAARHAHSGQCAHCGDPTERFVNGGYRKRCTKHKARGPKQDRRPERAAWVAATDDGTLTPTALAGLFAAAKVCTYCDAPMAWADKTLDHVVPLSRGGAHSIRNAAVCCKFCNTSKGRKLLSEWQPRHDEEKDSSQGSVGYARPRPAAGVHSLVL